MSLDYLDLAREVTRAAAARGADDCDCFIETGRELTIKARSGEVESIERAAFHGLGVRFFSKHRLGFGFTTDFSAASIAALLDQCRAYALAATPDPEAGIPEAADLADGASAEDLEINDETIDDIPMEEKIEFALASEAAAYAADKRIKHTYSAAYGDVKGRVIIARMGREPLCYDATSFEAFSGPVAEAEGEKRMGVWMADARYFADLEPAAVIGQNAARRAVAMLGATTPATCKAPVVFDPLVACDVVSDVFHALEGSRVSKGMSFLKDRLGKRVGSQLATFVDDGRLPRRMGTRPFDVEGIPTRRIPAIAKGVLKAYFYDYRSARKASASPTGNARRGFASIPDVAENNFYLIPGTTSRDDLLAAVKNGLVVTRMLGFGVNITTGDYSRGAEGIWYKDGKPSHPVSGVTIASNLGDMLNGIEAVASDLRFFGRFGSPTFAVAEMTIAGQ